MNGLGRRVDQLEKQRPASFAGEIWCCASEIDAQTLLDDLRARNAPPPMLFIASGPDANGALTWKRQGDTVDALFRAVEGYCSNADWNLEGTEPEVAPNPLFSQMSDKELLEVVTEG